MKWFTAWMTDLEVRNLQSRVRDLEEQLTIEQSKVSVRDSEITELAAVIARNLRRIQSETDSLNAKER